MDDIREAFAATFDAAVGLYRKHYRPVGQRGIYLFVRHNLLIHEGKFLSLLNQELRHGVVALAGAVQGIQHHP